MELYCKTLPTNVLRLVPIILGNQFNSINQFNTRLTDLSPAIVVTLTEYRC